MTPETRAKVLVQELWSEEWIGKSLSFPQGFPRNVERRITKVIHDAIAERNKLQTSGAATNSE